MKDHEKIQKLYGSVVELFEAFTRRVHNVQWTKDEKEMLKDAAQILDVIEEENYDCTL